MLQNINNRERNTDKRDIKTQAKTNKIVSISFQWLLETYEDNVHKVVIKYKDSKKYTVT